MRSEEVTLGTVAPGTSRRLTRHLWGEPGARPKVYLQAALHADEMPGVIALWHLMPLLDQAEADGRITGEIALVPFANPIGLTHWLNGKPQGRHDLDTGSNFNRGFADLTELAGDALEGRLGADPEANVALIRQAFATALDAIPAGDEASLLRRALLRWSHDADIVLDLHCDHVSVMHTYVSSARPDLADLLARSTGAVLTLTADLSGGNAFDEAHTAPWRALRARFPDAAIPDPCFSATVEYRGQADVSDDQGAKDALNLMTFLAAAGALTGAPPPAHPPALTLPLAATLEAFVPQAGVITWAVAPGAHVTEGQPLAFISDPVTRRRLPLPAPTSGLFFRREMWPFCLAGQSLAHVAGQEILRHGDLLSN